MTYENFITHGSLYITHRCNLNCTYCYRKNRQGSMDEETLKNAIDFLLSHSHKRLSINFFGGEPLLEYPLLVSAISYALEQGKECQRGITFSINTNGTLMNRNILNLVRQTPTGITLSIDGVPKAHNTHRKTPQGEGSFQMLYEKIPLFLEIKNRVHIRMTVTSETVKYMLDSVKYIYGLGFKSLAIAMDRSGVWTDLSKNLYAKQYKDILEWYLDILRKEEKFYLVDLDYGSVSLDFPYPSKGIPCKAATSAIAIGIDGKIYPCYRFVGLEETCIGDIFHGFDEERRKFYFEYSIEDITPCNKCPFNFRCHRCPWLSLILAGNLSQPLEINCFEASLMINLFIKLRAIMEQEKNSEFKRRKEQILKHFFTPKDKV